MKIDNHLPERDVIEISTQKQVEKQHKLIASIRPHRGHTLFEINLQTGDVLPAEFETVNADFVAAIHGCQEIKKKVIARNGCVYYSALNKESAIRKLKKDFAQGEAMINGMKN